MPHSLDELNWALLAPLRVLAYALPISLALPIGIIVRKRLPADDPRRDRIAAITLAVIAALAIGVIVGIGNPRYSYVPLPLLAPLFAAVVALSWDSTTNPFPDVRDFLDNSLRCLGVLLPIVHVVVTIMAFRFARQAASQEHFARPTYWLLGCAAGSALLGMTALFLPWRFTSARAWTAAAMLTLLTVPFASMKNAQRTFLSGREAAIRVREIVGADQHVSTAALLRDFPQVFYYANVPVDPFGEHGWQRLADAPGPRWILLNAEEFDRLHKLHGDRFLQITPLHLPHDTLYLARYRGSDSNRATEAASRPYNGMS